MKNQIAHHARIIENSAAPQHTVVAVPAMRSSWRPDDVAGLAEPGCAGIGPFGSFGTLSSHRDL